MDNHKYFCIHCMREKKENETICSHCGFDMSKYAGPEHALQPLTILNGRFLLGRVLGSGGFGITYVAWDLILERKVAIKEYYIGGAMYRDSKVSSQISTSGTSASQKTIIRSNLARFEKEAKILAGLNNLPGIVQVYDFFKENNTLYTVMEFLDGQTLQAYLKSRGGRIGWNETMEKLGPVMESLQLLHEREILHRDISPDNMMVLSSPRDQGKIKLFDFGGAKDLNTEDVDHKSTILLRKKGYSPFEQVSGQSNQGPWTDVYAMAATIYDCLCGQPPIDVFYRIEDPQSLILPSLLGADISPEKERVLTKGLEVLAKDRFQTMESFRKALMESPGIEDGRDGTDDSESGIYKDNRDNTGSKTGRPDKDVKKGRYAIIAVLAGIAVVVIVIVTVLSSRKKPGGEIEAVVTEKTVATEKESTITGEVSTEETGTGTGTETETEAQTEAETETETEAQTQTETEAGPAQATETEKAARHYIIIPRTRYTFPQGEAGTVTIDTNAEELQVSVEDSEQVEAHLEENALQIVVHDHDVNHWITITDEQAGFSRRIAVQGREAETEPETKIAAEPAQAAETEKAVRHYIIIPRTRYTFPQGEAGTVTIDTNAEELQISVEDSEQVEAHLEGDALQIVVHDHDVTHWITITDEQAGFSRRIAVHGREAETEEETAAVKKSRKVVRRKPTEQEAEPETQPETERETQPETFIRTRKKVYEISAGGTEHIVVVTNARSLQAVTYSDQVRAAFNKPYLDVTVSDTREAHFVDLVDEQSGETRRIIVRGRKPETEREIQPETQPETERETQPETFIRTRRKVYEISAGGTEHIVVVTNARSLQAVTYSDQVRAAFNKPYLDVTVSDTGEAHFVDLVDEQSGETRRIIVRGRKPETERGTEPETERKTQPETYIRTRKKVYEISAGGTERIVVGTNAKSLQAVTYSDQVRADFNKPYLEVTVSDTGTAHYVDLVDEQSGETRRIIVRGRKPEAEREIQPETEPETEREIQPETQPETERETQPETERETQPAADMLYNAGVEAFNEGDYVSAREYFEKAIEEADVDPEVYSYLGAIYENGLGVEQDYEKAVSYVETGTDMGDPSSMDRMGSYYYRGTGVARDVAKARELFVAAADQGYPMAMANLAHLYYSGDGVEQDYGKAFLLLQQAMDQGAVDGIPAMIGMMYGNGEGVEKNDYRTFYYFQLGADQEDGWSTFYLGTCYEFGTGTAPDYEKAEELYRQAEELGLDPEYVELSLESLSLKKAHMWFKDLPAINEVARGAITNNSRYRYDDEELRKLWTKRHSIVKDARNLHTYTRFDAEENVYVVFAIYDQVIYGIDEAYPVYESLGSYDVPDFGSPEALQQSGQIITNADLVADYEAMRQVDQPAAVRSSSRLQAYQDYLEGKSEPEMVTVSVNSLNVRSSYDNGTPGSVIGQLNSGDQVRKVCDVEGDWMIVEYGDTLGYVASEYVN